MINSSEPSQEPPQYYTTTVHSLGFWHRPPTCHRSRLCSRQTCIAIATNLSKLLTRPPERVIWPLVRWHQVTTWRYLGDCAVIAVVFRTDLGSSVRQSHELKIKVSLLKSAYFWNIQPDFLSSTWLTLRNRVQNLRSTTRQRYTRLLLRSTQVESFWIFIWICPIIMHEVGRRTHFLEYVPYRPWYIWNLKYSEWKGGISVTLEWFLECGSTKPKQTHPGIEPKIRQSEAWSVAIASQRPSLELV